MSIAFFYSDTCSKELPIQRKWKVGLSLILYLVLYFCILRTCNSCLLEVWEWAVSESIFCSIWSPAELPPCLELPVISIFFSPTMNFAFFSCLGMETFSIPSLIRIWSRCVSQRLICVNKIRPLKQRLDAVSTNVVLKRHLAPHRTRPPRPRHLIIRECCENEFLDQLPKILWHLI